MLAAVSLLPWNNLVGRATEKKKDSHELDERTAALEAQIKDLQNVEFQLRASSDYGVRLVPSLGL